MNKLTAQLLWQMFCIGGCSVVVFGLGHSGWWFVLALLMAP